MGIDVLLGLIDWNPSFGITDLVGIAAAGLTLHAVFISSRAAKSAEQSSQAAKEATKHAEEQTKLLKEQYEYSLTPKLLPDTLTIHQDPITVTGFGESPLYGDLNLKVKNVGKGNAYYIRTWIELDDVDKLIANKENISFSHSAFDTYAYKMDFLPEDRIATQRLRVDESLTEGKKQIRSSIRHFDIVHITTPWVALNENQYYDFPVYAYIQALLLHCLLQDKRLNDYKFSLYITYKTEAQLGTDVETKTKFDIYFSHGKSTFGYKESSATLTIFFLPTKS
ncbi:hypothetical protein [Exiguobacterium aurantiacum]|uniref:Uncharacterized protein n=1 Tax=Exiguobacterium aurantiacum TaxID=33987 RepID=A0A377FUS3_9BACL|nr:hypothetical protein [Exiguobacterium aurantiacum]STO08083.1 Uncharacterised protein [Exiguobacterium aurantiacum]